MGLLYLWFLRKCFRQNIFAVFPQFKPIFKICIIYIWYFIIFVCHKNMISKFWTIAFFEHPGTNTNASCAHNVRFCNENLLGLFLWNFSSELKTSLFPFKNPIKQRSHLCSIKMQWKNIVHWVQLRVFMGNKNWFPKFLMNSFEFCQHLMFFL